MVAQRNSTVDKTQNAVEPYKFGEFDAYISYLALGGLITSEEDGTIHRMTLTRFCEIYHVDRKTTLNWRKNTPDLWDQVRKRREEIMPAARESAWFNQLHLLGMQSQDKRAAVDALKVLTGHFSGLRLPAQDVKHEAGDSWAALISEHEDKHANVIEGEVTDANPTEN